jgi:branched-chain amino acid transport system substrate-binding protein
MACAPPDLMGTNFSCVIDDDCKGGKICGQVGGVAACVLPPAGPVRIGMSAPFQGPSEDLGIELRRGIQALFKRVNDDGGLFGRPLELDALNDNYDPDTAFANVEQLLDVVEVNPDPDLPDVRGANSVLALLGNVGTPTMLRTAPVATKNQVVFFAPFTGSQKYLRDGTNSPYVFNYRAGYYEETEAMIDYLASYRTPRIIGAADSYTHLLAFTQNDSYGDAGYSGLVTAYNTRVGPLPQPDSALPNPSIARVRYTRDDLASVDATIVEAEQWLSAVLAQAGPGGARVAIVAVDTYQPGNKFIRAIKDWINHDVARASLLDVLFLHVSFVGSDSLANALTSAPETYLDVTDVTGLRRKSYSAGVMVTQVVPYYGSQAAGVSAYRADLGRFDGGAPSFTSLEGHVAATLLVEALRRNGPLLDSAHLVDTLTTKITDLDLGIGTLLSFSPVGHQASHTVWGSGINDDGTFALPFTWNPQDRIIPGSD